MGDRWSVVGLGLICMEAQVGLKLVARSGYSTPVRLLNILVGTRTKRVTGERSPVTSKWFK